MVSESLAECILENFSISPLGTIFLDTEKVNHLFSRNDLAVDTSYLAENLFMEAFKDKKGPNVPLDVRLGLKRPMIKFGEGSDILLSYILKFDVYVKDTHEHLMYDELHMVIDLDASTMEDDRDFLNLHINALKLDLSSKYG